MNPSGNLFSLIENSHFSNKIWFLPIDHTKTCRYFKMTRTQARFLRRTIYCIILGVILGDFADFERNWTTLASDFSTYKCRINIRIKPRSKKAFYKNGFLSKILAPWNRIGTMLDHLIIWTRSLGVSAKAQKFINKRANVHNNTTGLEFIETFKSLANHFL